jgi:predicted transcriptional regulator
MRTLIDVPDDQLRSLGELAARSNRSRSAVIREAIKEYLADHRLPPAEDGFGLWGSTGPDGLKYQKKLRAEW